MASVSAKVAVSIPGDLYRAVEKARKRIGKSRSAILQDAIRLWLKQQEEVALVQRYETGYRARPEGRGEVEAAQAAAVRLLASTEW
jgi:metal-responsive CopG/Arc/MetJ family transcriptional regulator